ncbi:MAG TPA: trypsin-like peptidase domain-containing protein [Actinomycetota bacterium]|nr:trypsin-like peptidase domain-containing protein [Actinomycetota bacterium]
MSIRDGVEPSRSPDSDTHTQPLSADAATPDDQAGPAPASPQPSEAPWPPASPADQTWPPSWGQAPASADGPGSTPPPAPQGPGYTPPPAAQGPSWTQPKGPEAGADQAQPGWGQGGGGGGYPTVPGWGPRPADAGSPRGRRPSRWLAGVVAGAVLLAAGYGISEAVDRDAPAPAGAGIPTAAPVAAAPAQSGEEPAAAVARALLPTVVEIRHGSGVGSGFVYDSNGYILTAAHVIEGVDEVSVRLYDGTTLRGQVVGTDESNDVGVVKVDRTGLKAAPLAIGQTTQVGQLAVAIGSPFGLNETVTAGIVSSTDRILDDGREVIQTDAPINPGNSGGVLANRQGRVIGINSAIRPGDGNSNGNVGIGFAVPIDIAARSAESIVEGKPVQIGYLGVQMAQPTGNQDGVLVQVVTPGSPAEQAGLRAGDLVVAIDGQAVASTGELGARIRSHKPGDKISLKVVRDGKETTMTATLTQRPAG